MQCGCHAVIKKNFEPFLFTVFSPLNPQMFLENLFWNWGQGLISVKGFWYSIEEFLFPIFRVLLVYREGLIKFGAYW